MKNGQPVHWNTCKTIFIMIMVLVASSSCTSLPEYARPQINPIEEGGSATQEGFSYRILTVSDFQATSLPPSMKEHVHHIRARSCITIRPTGNSKINIDKFLLYGHETYSGKFENISFEAIFIPSCSWFDPQIGDEEKPYVLQHEQIHFGITELEARKLTLKAKKNLGNFIAFGKKNSEVMDELMGKIKESLQDASSSELKAHTEFDEDTSGSYAPKIQRLWLIDVEERLTEHEPQPDHP
jgi:hypothetical protein